MFKRLDSQRLIALFLWGWLMLNFPLLGLWDQDVQVAGLPFFPVAIFVLWGLLIAAMAWLMERVNPDPQDD
jgi:hypothetical protein